MIFQVYFQSWSAVAMATARDINVMAGGTKSAIATATVATTPRCSCWRSTSTTSKSACRTASISSTRGGFWYDMPIIAVNVNALLIPSHSHHTTRLQQGADVGFTGSLDCADWIPRSDLFPNGTLPITEVMPLLLYSWGYIPVDQGNQMTNFTWVNNGDNTEAMVRRPFS